MYKNSLYLSLNIYICIYIHNYVLIMYVYHLHISGNHCILYSISCGVYAYTVYSIDLPCFNNLGVIFHIDDRSSWYMLSIGVN